MTHADAGTGRTAMQKLCLVYFVVILGVASINYLPVPGLVDEDGMAFGIFALDVYDDALHLVSALWALVAGLWSHRAATVFGIVFGALYLLDGLFGIATGWGFLDLGILTNPSAGFSLSVPRVLANLPHIGLGGIALAFGLAGAQR